MPGSAAGGIQDACSVASEQRHGEINVSVSVEFLFLVIGFHLNFLSEFGMMVRKLRCSLNENLLVSSPHVFEV